MRVLPSTAGQATFVVGPLGCPATQPANCTQTRGGTFDSSKSKSWKSIGNYTLGLEQNLGYNETATYGFDALALGLSDATGSSTLQTQVIADIETDDYYMGIFGLGHQPYNFTNFQDPHPSFLTTMRSKNWIPSLSWAYTAGAQYRKLQHSIHCYLEASPARKLELPFHLAAPTFEARVSSYREMTLRYHRISNFRVVV